MAASGGSSIFQASGDAYDEFMGRYAQRLAPLFADFIGISSGTRFLDVGSGPGALTEQALALGAAVSAIDPAPGFVADCAARFPAAVALEAAAERLPFGDDHFDAAAAQLVFHFIGEPLRAVDELRRVVRPGGTIAACVWDLHGRMDLFRVFWSAVGAALPAATLPGVEAFGAPGELAEFFTDCGVHAVVQHELQVTRDYGSVDELWGTLTQGVGPIGAYVAGLSTDDRDAVRAALRAELGAGGFTLTGIAYAVRGNSPS